MGKIYDDPFTADEIENAKLKCPKETEEFREKYIRFQRVRKEEAKYPAPEEVFTAEEIEQAKRKYPRETEKGIMIYLRFQRSLQLRSLPWNELVKEIERRHNCERSGCHKVLRRHPA